MKLIYGPALALLGIFGFTHADRAIAHEDDDPIVSMWLFEELENRDPGGDNDFSWDAKGWIGKDLDKLWIKTEGEREGGETEHAELSLWYGKAIATYWDMQIGVRHDIDPSPSRNWLGFGFYGLAPYFFEIDTAFFVGESGRTALRFEAEYELLLTQRLIISPAIEVNLYGKDDPLLGIASGLSDIEAGIRLRYEIRREIAPYIGLNWTRQFGGPADFARAAGHGTTDSQFVVGLRAWF